MACSVQCAQDYVSDARVDLIEQLKNLPLIIEKLYQKKVLNNTEVSDLEAIPEKCRKARKVLDWITNKGKDACLEFLKILDLERKSVLPLKLHTWISHFSFGEESDDIQGPTSCHEIRTLLKTKAKEILDQQCKRSNHFFGGNAKQKFTYIPLVLDRDTEKNKPHNKVIHKSKKSKKPRGKKLRSYIPKDTCRNTPEDLLNSQEKSILLVGKPGIGKTTAVKQMLYFWAERHDENLDFMFYFDKNVLTNIATSNLQSLLLDTLIMSNADLRQKAEEITQYLEDYSEKVTIIFDGISGFHDNNILLRIIHHELLPEAKIVVTCRPETEDDDFFDWPTCKVYVQGFSEESIYTYLTQMPDQDPELVNSVVDNPALFSLCHVPMYAFMVAACFSYYTSEGAHKQCTATELYIRIFRHCIQRHGNKKLRHLDAHIKDCKDKILLLAESAFSATKLKTINLEFDYSDSCIAGVFLRSVSVVSPAFARTFCSFLHNTIQEFFSALWLLEKPQKLHEVLQLCQTEEYKHMKYMIPFLCGLLSETTIPLLKCLFPPDQPKGTCHGFFEKVLKTFLHDEPDEEYSVDAVFLCQCLNELQSSEACLWFLERVDYSLDLSEEHLDPHQCCAVSYVISQSRDKPVHLNLENSVVSLSGLKTILRHSQNLRDLSMTLCQVWTAALKCEQQSYLINLLLLCGKEIYLPIITQKALHQQAGEIITQSADPVILHLCCGQNPQQLSDAFCRTISTWLPSISSVHFTTKQNQRESCEEWEKRVTLFKLNLCLQAALHQKENVQTTVKKVTLCGTDECNFLLDLYSHVKQYETETGRKVLPALLPVYQSTRAEWIIDLSERKASLLLEVLKLQTVKKPVELSGWSDEESEVRSFLQCLPYISQLRLAGTKYIEFVVILFHEAAESERQTGQKTLELLTSMCIKSSFPCGDTNNHIQSAFLLDLYSHVKQYETETGRTVLPALLPVYQSVPAEWIIDLSERRTSLLLEVLKLQTVKKPVELRGWSDEENEVKRFFQCLPFISQLRFAGTKDIEFVVNLFRNAAQSERRIRLKTLELLMSVCSLPYGNRNSYIQSDFLLDLYSNVKQYETETGRNVLPALRPVYQSVPAEWIIDVSERRTSLLLEVLKLQTVKKPVELRGWSDEESEVRSFLLCLPFISQLRFNPRFDLCCGGDDDDDDESVDFLVNLFHQAAESERQTGEKTLELLTSVCTYSSFPYGDRDSYRQSDFLLDLYSHVKQYETETGRNVLPALLPVYQSVPAEWIIHLSERRTSLLLEVLKLQTVKKPVKLRGWSDEESEVRSFLQCLPFISQLRYAESLVPYLNELVVNYTRETELLTALFSAMDSTFTVNGVLSSKKCRAVGRALGLSPSRLNLTLKPRAISLRGAALLFRHITHLHKLCLNDSVLGRMTQAFRAETTCVPLVIQELSVVMTSVWSTQKLSKILSSLVALLNLWTVQCLNLIECKMEAHSLIGIMCHPGTLIIRLSKETLQKFSFLVYEIKDKKLTCFFLEKVGGDLTSCSLSWEELLYFVQQGACCHVTVNTIKSKITSTHIKQLLPLLDKVHFKRLSSSIILSIIREIYETGSAHHVSSFLSSTENCINLNGRELDTIHWAALCFTLHNCTAISLSLLWASIPEREIESILHLLNRVSHLSVDRLLLLKLLHCCSVSELQERAAAAVLSSLQNILDFSCRACLDLTTQTEDTTLHLTTEDCRVISTVIQKAQKHTELILEDCEIEDAGVDVLFSALCTVRLCCSKALLLQFLALVRVGTEFEHMTRAVNLSKALDGKLDFSETQLDLQVCKSLALFLEYNDGLSELDLSYCQLSDHCLQLLLPHLHKIDMLDLSHNNISDNLARRITALFP